MVRTSSRASRLVAAVRSTRRGDGGLRAREYEVLRLIALGMANMEIGHALSISERTVRFHATSIFIKLGATSRTQAVALATERHLL